MSITQTMIKICCIMNKKELYMALELGVNHVGFVSSMPNGPGIIREEKIRKLAAYAPKDVNTFLLTSHKDTAKIAEQWKYCGTRTIQLCRPMETKGILHLRSLVPMARIVTVIHVQDRTALNRALRVSSVSHAILLDTGDLESPIQKLGGTGRTHDWNISRLIKQRTPTTAWLAGGLNLHNIKHALKAVYPDGIDVCSGVRTNGKLDQKKLSGFIEEVVSWDSSRALKEKRK